MTAEHMPSCQMQALHDALAAAHSLLDLPYADGSAAYKTRQQLLAERAGSVRIALAAILEGFDGDNRLATFRGTRSFLDDQPRLMAVNYETVEEGR